MTEIETPVLIVGGGVAGLSTALFLAWHDVPCMLVERHPDLLIHPRARGLTPRTVELYRQVGLEPAIRGAAYGGSDFAWTPVLAETLNDEAYHPGRRGHRARHRCRRGAAGPPGRLRRLA